MGHVIDLRQTQANAERQRKAAAIKAAFFEGAEMIDKRDGWWIADSNWPHSRAKQDYDDVLAGRTPTVINRV